MPAAGVVTIALIVLIVLALVYYLVSTIIQLRATNQGLDRVIAGVGEIVAKSAPVNDVVDDINANLDAAVSALEGLLVKKAGMSDALGLVDGLYPGAGAEGFRDFPESRATRPRGPGRDGQPRGPGPSQPGLRQRRRAHPLRGRPAGALARDRDRRSRPVRAA